MQSAQGAQGWHVYSEQVVLAIVDPESRLLFLGWRKRFVQLSSDEVVDVSLATACKVFQVEGTEAAICVLALLIRASYTAERKACTVLEIPSDDDLIVLSWGTPHTSRTASMSHFGQKRALFTVSSSAKKGISCGSR